MKRIIFILTMVLALGLTSCLEGPKPLLPEFKTLEPTDVTFKYEYGNVKYYSVVLRGMVGKEKSNSDDEEGSYRQKLSVRFIISDNSEFDSDKGWVEETRNNDAYIGEEYTQNYSGLEGGKTYYYKFVYAGGNKLDESLDYLWNVVSFKTPAN